MSSGASPLLLRAGPVKAEFEPWTGWLRRIRHGNRNRILALALYAAVRDESWGTYTPQVAITRHEQGENSFRLEWTLDFPEIGFQFSASAEGGEEGTVVARWEGRPTRPFSTKRTGLCLLHPLDQAGAAFVARHSDGSTTQGRLPDLISPHQPLFDLSGLVVEGVADFAMEGEVFEMEDQRNWSDPSFKTYCRPLAWPSPYEVSEPFHHQVKLSPLAGAPEPSPIQLEGAIPPLGFFGSETGSRPAGPGLVSIGSQEGDVLAWDEGKEGVPCSWAAVSQPEKMEEARAALPGVPLLLASRDSFVSLNRMEPKPPCQGVLFGLNPQVHAFDDRSIMETLWSIPDLIRSAQALAPGGTVAVGPFRFSGQAPHLDDRLKSPLGRAYRTGAILMAAASGASLLFPFSAEEGEELAGWRARQGEKVAFQGLPFQEDVLEFKVGEGSCLINSTPLPQEAEGLTLGPWEVAWR